MGFFCFSMLGTVLLYERLYFCRSIALAPPRLPFFGGIRDEGDFFYRDFPCLLTPSSLSLISCLAVLRLASCSAAIMTRFPNIVPSYRPAYSTRRAGRFMATGRLLAGGTVD